jgi:hypothetical protein
MAPCGAAPRPRARIAVRVDAAAVEAYGGHRAGDAERQFSVIEKGHTAREHAG